MDITQADQSFFSDPRIREHDALLRKIGVFRYTEELNREIQSYKSLLAGAADVFNQTTTSEIMDAAVRQLSDQFLPSFIVFLWKPYQNKEDVNIKAYKDRKPVEMPVNINTLAPFESFFQTCREPVCHEDLIQNLGSSPYRNAEGGENVIAALRELRPHLVVPILGPPGLYGLILVGHKSLAQADYTCSELKFIGQLTSFVSQAIQNHLHYERSVRDVKTGLFNHGFFSTRLHEEMSRARRTGVESSLVVIDVDKFKLFNDNYGHLAGDRVLECLAMGIKQSVRSEDIPSRFGGEEFTILLPNTDRKSAFLVAERLRIAVLEMKVPWETPLPRVTISLGVVTFNGETNVPADEVLNRADEALYRSKEDGRNRTTAWEPGFRFKLEQEKSE